MWNIKSVIFITFFTVYEKITIYTIITLKTLIFFIINYQKMLQSTANNRLIVLTIKALGVLFLYYTVHWV